MQNKDRLFRPNITGLQVAATITIKTKNLTKKILEHLLKNKVVAEIYEDINSYNLFKKTEQGLLTFQGRTYVLTGIQGEIFKIYHKAESFNRHQGIEKTIKKIS